MIFDFLQTNWFEIVAAILAIAYLILAMLEDIRCWIAWVISSLMYFFVMYSANLYMEALLQIFYIFIGLYGLYQWRFKSDLNDALKITTWGAIAASYLVAKKVLENWFYWFVIDFVSVFLFISRELYPTALLFVVYLVLVVFGYSAWRKSWQLADE